VVRQAYVRGCVGRPLCWCVQSRQGAMYAAGALFMTACMVLAVGYSPPWLGHSSIDPGIICVSTCIRPLAFTVVCCESRSSRRPATASMRCLPSLVRCSSKTTCAAQLSFVVYSRPSVLNFDSPHVFIAHSASRWLVMRSADGSPAWCASLCWSHCFFSCCRVATIGWCRSESKCRQCGG
jgi:hypothetical protein